MRPFGNLSGTRLQRCRQFIRLPLTAPKTGYKSKSMARAEGEPVSPLAGARCGRRSPQVASPTAAVRQSRQAMRSFWLLTRLLVDIWSMRLLVWMLGRNGELLDSHLFFFDRYSDLADYHRAAGRTAVADRLAAIAEAHYQAAPDDEPPDAAATAMPVPRPPLHTNAVSSTRLDRQRVRRFGMSGTTPHGEAHDPGTLVKSVGGVLVLTALMSCGAIAEPGLPPPEPTPLFDGFVSYRTVSEMQQQLPDRSTWKILSDSKIAARGPCPRFDELTFTIPASHLGHSGRLQLVFINDRLTSTAFTPDEFRSYVDALRASGVVFDASGQSSRPPATRIWQWDRGDPFVGWSDARFQAQTDAWISHCS